MSTQVSETKKNVICICYPNQTMLLQHNLHPVEVEEHHPYIPTKEEGHTPKKAGILSQRNKETPRNKTQTTERKRETERAYQGANGLKFNTGA